MSAKIRVRSQVGILPYLTLLLFILCLVDDFQGWRFLFAAAALTWGSAYFWARSLAKRLDFQREMRFGWAQVGDRLEERFTITNKGWLPALWVELNDHSNLPGYKIDIVTGLDGTASHRWRTKIICQRRGLFTLGPTTIKTSDPLGLYPLEIEKQGTMQLLVTPPILPLPSIQVSAGGRAGEGQPHPHTFERTVSTAGVREYHPGDSLQYIHWKKSAHHDEFMVRIFENRPSGDWWLVLDLDEGVQAGEGAKSTVEHGITLTASLVDRGLRGGKAVGLIANGNPEIWLSPRKGEGQRWDILKQLAIIEKGQRTLAETLHSSHRDLKGVKSLVIITANTGTEWLEALLEISHSGIVPTILILDARQYGGEGNSQMAVELARQWGMHSQLIPPEMLEPPDAFPGSRGQRQWRVTPMGRVIPRIPQRELSWRKLQ